MRFKLLMVLLVSSSFVVSAQTATTAKVIDFAVAGGTFTVELKGCFKNNDANFNVVCNFIFTNKAAIDFALGYRVYTLFRAFDSSGTNVSIERATKGNNSWSGEFPGTFASQLPTPVRIGFKLPIEDTVVTLLDLIGDKVTRWALIPIVAQ
jgi:hypothetical protein